MMSINALVNIELVILKLSCLVVLASKPNLIIPHEHNVPSPFSLKKGDILYLLKPLGAQSLCAKYLLPIFLLVNTVTL